MFQNNHQQIPDVDNNCLKFDISNDNYNDPETTISVKFNLVRLNLTRNSFGKTITQAKIQI